MNTLKTIGAVTLILLIGSTRSFAQSFKRGDKLFNVGIGVGGGLGIPAGVSYEQAVSDRISVGGYLAYARKKESWNDYGEWKYSYLLAAARASYHLKVDSERFDPYGGIMLGYNVASVKWGGEGSEPISTSAGGLMWGVYVGSRYWASDKVGAFAEVGYGAAVLNLGVALRL
ncbi:hypothetical protein [Sphingobacterium sp. SYP-B4668]|uniref:hypothetical protein n=1 Tax=Sphingobacterium sp. SYP-B4668 TaxID=2996035 RepID=UPI0022DD11B9|nr:hypothetical protein [Sphingobacterium sp. SYP-B4668]